MSSALLIRRQETRTNIILRCFFCKNHREQTAMFSPLPWKIIFAPFSYRENGEQAELFSSLSCNIIFAPFLHRQIGEKLELFSSTTYLRSCDLISDLLLSQTSSFDNRDDEDLRSTTTMQQAAIMGKLESHEYSTDREISQQDYSSLSLSLS